MKILLADFSSIPANLSNLLTQKARELAGKVIDRMVKEVENLFIRRMSGPVVCHPGSVGCWLQHPTD